ncbi:MAG: DNA methylase, partial [Bacteroidetes bacterium]|nr:DNA methylase [Bacteroidota bacterium]
MAYNQYHKLTANIAAIRTAIEWERTNAKLGADDLSTLRAYSGFGGLKAILYPATDKATWEDMGASDADLRLYEPIMALHELLQSSYPDKAYQAIVASLKNSVLTSFYTPDFIPQTIFTALAKQGVQPRRFYEPSAGAGIFIDQAIASFPSLTGVQAIEKDILCGKLLKAMAAHQPITTDVRVDGLEATGPTGDHQFDLVASNIPFGNFQVHDPLFPDKQISGKIHNYFFAKGLDRLADGGILAYVTTDAFLNSPSNRDARSYLFARADFISLAVMPDNLMKDTGNTEAPSHLLIVQKKEGKNGLTDTEQQLVATMERQGPFGSYPYNCYIDQHTELLLGDEITEGKNQYGLASRSVWQRGELFAIAERLNTILSADLAARLDTGRFNAIRLAPAVQQQARQPLTFLPMPETSKENAQVQLGLFDTVQADTGNRAMAYLSEEDKTIIAKETARIVSIIRTDEQPAHESIVMLVGQALQNRRYLYRLYSNLAEINPPKHWLNGESLNGAINNITDQLRSYSHRYRYEGDQTLEPSFNLRHTDPFELRDIKA